MLLLDAENQQIDLVLRDPAADYGAFLHNAVCEVEL